MSEAKTLVGVRKECCTKAENLEPQESGRPDLAITRCRECGCRHFEATVDPGKIFAKPSPLR